MKIFNFCIMMRIFLIFQYYHHISDSMNWITTRVVNRHRTIWTQQNFQSINTSIMLNDVHPEQVNISKSLLGNISVDTGIYNNTILILRCFVFLFVYDIGCNAIFFSLVIVFDRCDTLLIDNYDPILIIELNFGFNF